MAREIDQLISYTNNLRLAYHTKIIGEFEIKIENNITKIFLPKSLPTTATDYYKKDMTIFLMGEEMITNLKIGINNCGDVPYWNSQGIVSIESRKFVGSIANGGFYKINNTETINDQMVITIDSTDAIEEKWIGAISLSAWKFSDSNVIKLKEYQESQFSGSGLIMEKVKNYQYQVSSGGDKIDSKTGLPKDLISPFKRFKKLPNALEKQLWKLIRYV